MSGTKSEILQSWIGARIMLSYLISVTGSYCTIQLMEQWRRIEEAQYKRILLMLSAMALGGCGIWCMHFTGMNALELELEDGTQLQIDFELGLTVLSFAFSTMGVLVGLKIASSDPFFLEIQAERRKLMLSSSLKKIKMNVVVNKTAVHRRIKLAALFSRPWFILIGGAFTALGVLGMHYIGMLAQRTNAIMHFHPPVVGASVVIAFVAASAAFWILFRILTFMPDSEALRLGSALIMGVAVCATHYSGMCAATYTVSDEDFTDTTRIVISGKSSAEIASNAALLVSYWLTSASVARSVRLMDRQSSQHNGSKGNGPESKVPTMKTSGSMLLKKPSDTTMVTVDSRSAAAHGSHKIAISADTAEPSASS